MKNFLTMLFFFKLLIVVAQNNELPKTNQVHLLKQFDVRYEMLNNYLIQENYAPQNNDALYLFNLYTWNEFDLSDTYGIYVFGLKESDPSYFLFFENKDKSYLIIQKNSLPLILNAAIVFFEKNDIQDKETQLFYTLSLLMFYNSNNGYLLNEKILPRDWHK